MVHVEQRITGGGDGVRHLAADGVVAGAVGEVFDTWPGFGEGGVLHTIFHVLRIGHEARRVVRRASPETVCFVPVSRAQAEGVVGERPVGETLPRGVPAKGIVPAAKENAVCEVPGIKRLGPVRLCAGIVAGAAEERLVRGDEVSVKRQEPAGVVDHPALQLVGGLQVVEERAGFVVHVGEARWLAHEALLRGDVLELLGAREGVPGAALEGAAAGSWSTWWWGDDQLGPGPEVEEGFEEVDGARS